MPAIGDVAGLARAMVAAWRGEAPFSESGFRRPRVLEEMTAPEAIARFVTHAVREA